MDKNSKAEMSGWERLAIKAAAAERTTQSDCESVQDEDFGDERSDTGDR